MGGLRGRQGQEAANSELLRTLGGGNHEQLEESSSDCEGSNAGPAEPAGHQAVGDQLEALGQLLQQQPEHDRKDGTPLAQTGASVEERQAHRVQHESQKLFSARSRPTDFADLGTSKGELGDEEDEVILRLEFLSASQTRRVVLLLRATVLFAIGATFSYLAFLKGDRASLLRSNKIFIFNVVAAAAMLCLLLDAAASSAMHLWKARGKRWSRRRRRLVSLFHVELAVQIVAVATYLAPNAVILALPPCNFFHKAVNWLGVVRWSCWNTASIISWIHGELFQPTNRKACNAEDPEQSGGDGAEGRGKIVLDSPLTCHLPKLLWWVAAEVIIICFGLVLTDVVPWSGALRDGDHTPVPGEPLCWRPQDICNTNTFITAMTSAMVGSNLLLGLVYMRAVIHTRVALSQRPYCTYRMANTSTRLQSRLRCTGVVCMALSACVLWFAGIGSCNAYVQSWLGLFPVQLIQTVLVTINCYLYGPATPNQDLPLQAWLQEVAWTEAQKAARLAAHGPGYRHPMFCFETAIKLFYWSALVYDHAREDPQSKRQKTELGMGLQLFGLHKHELIHDQKVDVKALLGWSRNALVISFRGTASMANVISDLKAWTVWHGPLRGPWYHRPAVHRGFLGAWTSTGLRDRLVARVAELVREAADEDTQEPFRIYITGHSMGGGLALLAATDLQRALQGSIAPSTRSMTPSSGSGQAARLGPESPPHSSRAANGASHIPSGSSRQTPSAASVTPVATSPASSSASETPFRSTSESPSGFPPGGSQPQTSESGVTETSSSGGGRVPNLAHGRGGNPSCSRRAVHVAVYTYGAPRTGNHAFAAEYDALVPDTWHVINDQDIVVHRGKFWRLYKRPGQRCIINQLGDLVVRPAPVEVSLGRAGAGSLQHHYLVSYKEALLAVIAAQLGGKSMDGGLKGVVDLAGQLDIAQIFSQALAEKVHALRALFDWSAPTGRGAGTHAKQAEPNVE